MLGELGGDMEDDYSLPQDVEEVYIPSTKDEELGGLFASTMQIADREVNSYIQTSPGSLLQQAARGGLDVRVDLAIGDLHRRREEPAELLILGAGDVDLLHILG